MHEASGSHLAVLLTGLLAATAPTQAPSQPEPSPPQTEGGRKGVLELVSGERIAGSLPADAHDAGLPWSSPAFATPLVFGPGALGSVAFDAVADGAAPAGEFRATFGDGDVILGDLLAIDAEAVTLATQRHGELVVPRRALAELRRRVGGSIAYVGPSSLLEWTPRRGETAPTWRAMATSLAATGADAELFRDGMLTSGCRVDCSLSWTGSPGFRIVLGAAADPTHDDQAVILETWGSLLVAFREWPDRVDVVALPTSLRGRTDLRLRAVVHGDRVAFLDEHDAELGSIRTPTDAPLAAGFALRQKGDGELRLDHLQIERTGTAAAVLDGAAVVSLTRGSGRIATRAGGGTAPGTGAGGEIALADVDAIRFADATAQPAEPETGAVLLLQDGTRLSGTFAGTAGGTMLMATDWRSAPVPTTTAALKSLAVRGNPRPPFQHQYKLGIGDDRFLGRIVGWSADDHALVWQPTLAAAPSLLRSRADLRLDFAANSAWFVARTAYPHRILFTNADCVPCRIDSVGLDTIAFVEPFHGTRREVPAASVKAIEFDSRAVAQFVDDARIAPPTEQDKEKAGRRSWLLEARKQHERNYLDAGRREILLARPRKYKGRSPTHLFVAANGDAVRGVMTSVTDTAYNLSMTLSEDAAVPRDRVIAMVLFTREEIRAAEAAAEAADAGTGDDEATAPPGPPEPPPPTPADADGRLVLEIALDKETRVTLQVTRATPEAITGASELLGEVTIPYSDIVSMVSGSLRGHAAGFFSPWKLVPMKEPPY